MQKKKGNLSMICHAKPLFFKFSHMPNVNEMQKIGFSLKNFVLVNLLTLYSVPLLRIFRKKGQTPPLGYGSRLGQ